MQFTRKQIVTYLKVHHIASVPELSRVLSLTPSNIRHHIKELGTRNIIEQIDSLPPHGRGRPINRYRLSTETLHHNLAPLVKTLLEFIFTTTEHNEQRELVWKKIADRMVADYIISSNRTIRIQQSIRWLNSHNYQSRWEAFSTGPRVILSHCPYLSLLPTNPEICQIDREIISHLTGLHMKLENNRLSNPQRPHPCFFTPLN